MLARRSTKKERIPSDYKLTNSIRSTYFNLLHSRFSDDGLLDDSVDVHLVLLSHRSSLILGLTSESKSVGAIEVNLGVDLTNSLLLNALNLLSSSSSYID